jgi:cardiolipin synthase
MNMAIEVTWVLLYGALIVSTGLHALLNTRDPRAAWGWIAVCFLFPVAGAILYLLLGVNRVQTRGQRLGIKTSRALGSVGDDAGLSRCIATAGELPEALRPLAHTASGLTGLPLLSGNRLEPLHNGEQAYPQMLEAIEGARDSIALATYIFDTDTVGRQFIDALERAARRGVAVCCLVDGFGECYTWPRASTLLRRRNLTVARFNPPRLMPPLLYFNLRNHRKLLMVDGRVAFTGGMNISRRHLIGDTANPQRVSDLHFRVEGPILAQLQRTFAEDWRYATGEEWRGPDVDGSVTGTSLCRAITAGPNEDLDHLRLVLLAAIAAAERRVAVMTPYFLPSLDLVTALQSAALRGVSTQVILPGMSDSRLVHQATRHMLPALIERGVEIYFQPPPFAHAKLLLIDDRYTFIGSANLDPRSLRLNFELNLEAYDAGFNATLADHFDRVRAASRPVTAEQLLTRRFGTRLLDAASWLFSPYL